MIYLLSLLGFFINIFVSAYCQDGLPQVYGKVNLEYLQLDQDDKFMTRSGGGVFNVRGSETRMGVRGFYELDDMDVNYRLELGLDSTRVNPEGDPYGMSGRIRIRLAYIQLESQFGTLTLGQDATASSSILPHYDPLAHTFFGLSGLSQSEVIQGSKIDSLDAQTIDNNLGYVFRTRRDLIKYQSPRIGGVSWTVSVDRNDDNNVAKDTGGPTYFENMLNYKGQWGKTHFQIDLGHITWSTRQTQDENIFLAGLRLSFENGLSFNTVFSKEGFKEITEQGIARNQTDYIASSLKYAFGKKRLQHVAITYAKKSGENVGRDSDPTFLVDSNLLKTNQIAFGYGYQAHDNILFKATLGRINHKETDPLLASSFDNEVTVLASGVEVSF